MLRGLDSEYMLERSCIRMLSNDLKKGDRVRMRGTRWLATIADNKKGNIRLAEVEGWETELGSIYIWDIEFVLEIQGRFLNPPLTIDLTPAQAKDRDRINKAVTGR